MDNLRKVQKVLYFFLFVTSFFLALTTFYIEYRILSEMSQFGEPLYQLPQYNIRLKGNPATLAHLINIAFAIIALIVARVSYKNLRKK